MPLEARCLCGAVTLSFASDPTTSIVCHCRRFTGALAAIYVPFPKADVTVKGLPSMWTTTADSGRKMARYFCGGCGSSLYDIGQRRLDIVFVHGGTLPSGVIPVPNHDMYRRNAEEWEAQLGGCEVFPGMPPEKTNF